MKTTIFKMFVSKNTCIIVLLAMLLTCCLYYVFCLNKYEQSLQKREYNLRRVISELKKNSRCPCSIDFRSEELNTVPER